MEYSIKEAAQMLNIPISTIRYYDKEGLLPSLERKSSGYRAFSERDIETLKIVLWLKKAHMPLKEIARFIQLLQEGDASLHQRLELFERRRRGRHGKDPPRRRKTENAALRLRPVRKPSMKNVSRNPANDRDSGFCQADESPAASASLQAGRL